MNNVINILKIFPWVACQSIYDIYLYDIIDNASFKTTDNASFKTTYLLNNALDQKDVAIDWPYCIVTLTQKSAIRLRDLFIKISIDRGYEIYDVKPGRVILKGGSEYDFIAKELLERWIHGRYFFCDIVEDNEVLEAEKMIRVRRTRNPGNRLYG